MNSFIDIILGFNDVDELTNRMVESSKNIEETIAESREGFKKELKEV